MDSKRRMPAKGLPAKGKKGTKKKAGVTRKVVASKPKPVPGTEAYRSLGASGARRMSGGQSQGFTLGGGTGKAILIGKIPRRPKSKHGKGMGTTGDTYKPKRSKIK